MIWDFSLGLVIGMLAGYFYCDYVTMKKKLEPPQKKAKII